MLIHAADAAAAGCSRRRRRRVAARAASAPPATSPASNDAEQPTFSCPVWSGRTREASLRLPVLLYLPGLDGSGWAAVSQFDRLHELFELHCMRIPVQSRLSLPELCASVVAHAAWLAEETPGRPIVLFGESMGGLLAIASAQSSPSSFSTLVVVNPGTSFATSAWPQLSPLLPQLPSELYSVLPFALAPFLGDPLRIVASQFASAAASASAPSTTGSGRSSARSPPSFDPQAAAASLLEGIGKLGSLPKLLPPDTLAFRTSELLGKGGAAVEARGYGPPALPPALIVVGSADNLIPSAVEGPRLQKLFVAGGGSATLHVVQGGSHALLQEGSVCLSTLICEKGVYAPLLAQAIAAAQPPASAESAPGRRRPRAPGPGGIPLGTAALPTAAALERAAPTLSTLKKLVSPAWFSTTGSGKRVAGLAHLPVEGPLLFVGNHQLFAPDLGLLISELLNSKGRLLRGLAHPAVFQQLSGAGPFGGGGGGGGGGEGGSFASFGAVPVSGKNLYTLLSHGEAVLLFPGGVREAYKRDDEKYQLIWPDEPEFVRHAMRLGATVVPFSAVGAEDGFRILADADTLLSLPFVGDAVRANAEKMPAARAVDTRAAAGGRIEVFVPPLAVPTLPARYYFSFGAPIAAGERGSADDPEVVKALYAEVKGEVEGGIRWLLERRADDPFAELVPRMLYEAATGGPAPTFRP